MDQVQAASGFLPLSANRPGRTEMNSEPQMDTNEHKLLLRVGLILNFLNYLKITQLRVGLILNFKRPTLEWDWFCDIVRVRWCEFVVLFPLHACRSEAQPRWKIDSRFRIEAFSQQSIPKRRNRDTNAGGP